MLARGQVSVATEAPPATRINTRGSLANSFTKVEHSQQQLGKLAQTIANDDLSNLILDEHIDGVLGEALLDMTETLRGFATQARAIASGDLHDMSLAETGEGTLGTAFREMVVSLQLLATQVRAISLGQLDDEVLKSQAAGELGQQVSRLAGDIRSMQEQLLISERMSSMGMLAAGIGHEINNPLSYILGNLEWIHGEMIDAGLSVDLLDAIAETREGAERIRLITRDLNVFTRNHEMEPEPTDIGLVMESAIRIASGGMLTDVVLERDFAPVSPVLGTDGKLGQVFLNLIINAAQAIGKSPGTISVSIAQQESSVIVKVADTGPGIPPAIQGEIFEPFFSTKSKAGTGLGLAICKQIIMEFGGSIRAESDESGATFIVELQATDSVVRDTPQEPEEPTVSLHILVVDDDKGTARAIARMLNTYDVEIAESGEEALRACDNTAFDVILCDLMMPGMDGMQLFHKLPPELTQKVIFITGGAFTPKLHAFIKDTARPVLHKPVPLNELRAQIQNVASMSVASMSGPSKLPDQAT